MRVGIAEGLKKRLGNADPVCMAAPRASICITCGLDAGSGHALNRTADGRACPACAERLLDSLPPLFPGFGHLLESPAEPVRTRNAARELKPSNASAKRVRKGPKRGPK